MGLTDLKKELKKLDKDKLIELVAELYKKNKAAKEFLDFYVNPNEEELFGKYAEKVFQAFYPKRGYHLKLKEGRQAISDFKKLSPSKTLLANLMLYYVETGVEYTNDFGDINEGFYNSLELVYTDALTLMQKEDILDRFADRAFKVVEDTYGIGWGFHDYLAMVYHEYYLADAEEEENTTQRKGKVIKLPPA